MTVANLQSSKEAVFVPKRVAYFLNNKHNGCCNVTIGQWPLTRQIKSNLASNNLKLTYPFSVDFI